MPLTVLQGPLVIASHQYIFSEIPSLTSTSVLTTYMSPIGPPTDLQPPGSHHANVWPRG